VKVRAHNIPIDTLTNWGCVGVGKTHLCHRLRDSKYKLDKSTEGIDVILNETKGKKIKSINFCFYDLGGMKLPEFFFKLELHEIHDVWPIPF